MCVVLLSLTQYLCQDQKLESCAFLTLFLFWLCLYCKLNFLFSCTAACLSGWCSCCCGCCALHLEDGLVADGDVSLDDDGVGVPVGAF